MSMSIKPSIKNFENVFLLLICLIMVFLGCKQNKKIDDVKLLINIPEIANKSPSEVEKILGKRRIDATPEKQNKSKDFQDYRDFNIENGTVSVEFVDNKAVRFIVKPVQALEKDAILLGCGFEVDESKKIETEFSSILDWYGTFNNIEFEKIQIIEADKKGTFDRLQAFVMNEKTKVAKESKETTKQSPANTKPASNDISDYRKLLRSIDSEGTIVRDVNQGLSPDQIKITVANSFHYEPCQMRLQVAQKLWEAWARLHSPNEPDKARIKIVDLNDNEVGGSRVWAGSLIWVQEE